MTVGPPRDELHESEVGGDVTIYDANTEEVVVLNSTASDVWRLCDGEHAVDEIVELLASAYEVDPSDIRHDVEAIIDSFREKELFAGVESS